MRDDLKQKKKNAELVADYALECLKDAQDEIDRLRERIRELETSNARLRERLYG
jgi:hypothetical protein